MSKRPILIDAQLLVLLIVGATRPDLVARHRRTSRYTRTDFEFLLDLLGFAPKFLFCPHVASEVSNLVAQHGEPERTALMAVLKALLKNASEAPISSALALDQPEFGTLGLADAAQLALCSPEAVLLTDDGPLFRAASARGAQALYFRDEKRQRGRFLA